MKLFLSLLMSFLATASYAQPKKITQATISTTTNVIAPDEEDASNVQNQGGGGFNFRNFGDGETKSTTFYKDAMVKTVIKTDMGRTTTLRNNETKMTTTLLEMMGNKTGFYASDDDQVEMKKKMDSMMKARAASDTNQRMRTMSASAPANIDIVYPGDIKKIAGYDCKKALIITTRILGIKDTTIAWFTPDIKFDNLHYTGGLSGFGAAVSSVNGLDKLDGFVMRYEMKMRRNRQMIVEVTKVETGKEIAAKEFDVPKDFDLKPIKEMQNMMGGRGNGGGQGMQIIRN
ncbi:MAG: hypothetical protein ABIY51_03225 [Ferruginibacter sp.]